tara:strand:- start:683 stop:952 length:270 start_codon:yes stop_codon:yes gene_type:complete
MKIKFGLTQSLINEISERATKMEVNQRLAVDDRVRLLYMDDPIAIPANSEGIVIGIQKTPWGEQFMVQWDNGRTLDIMDDADVWVKLSN